MTVAVIALDIVSFLAISVAAGIHLLNWRKTRSSSCIFISLLLFLFLAVLSNLLERTLGKLFLDPYEGVFLPIIWAMFFADMLRDNEFIQFKKSQKTQSVMADRLKLAIEGSELGTWDWDLPSGMVVYNHYWAQMLGYSLEEIGQTYLSWRKLVHPDDLQQAEGAIREHLANRTPVYEFEHRLKSKSGEWIWVLAKGRVLERASDGTAIRMCGTHLDISKRKNAEQELAYQGWLVDRIVKVNPAIVYVFSLAESRFRWINPNVFSALGYTEQYVLTANGDTLSRLVHPDDTSDVRLHFESLRNLRDLEVSSIESRIRDATGTWRHLLCKHTVFLRDPNGYVLEVVGSCTEITEYKRLEHDLASEKERLAVTLRSIGDAVITTDLAGNILTINVAGERLTGWTEADAHGRPLGDVFDVSDETGRRKLVLSESGSQLPGNLKLSTRDGRVVDIADTVNAIIDRSGNFLGGVLTFHDISERMKYEAILRSSLHQKDVLLQELYHRTKNNMLVISSLLELQAESSNREEIRNIIRESQGRIRTMALAHQKLYESRDLSRIDMREYIPELALLMRDSYHVSSERVEMKFDINDAKLLIDTAIPCGLIIAELLSNAFKHAFPNDRAGVITLSLRRKDMNHLELTIKDNGIGKSSDVDLQKSSSLGIQLVMRIARHQLHASIEVETTNGFRWYLLFPTDLYSERV